MELAAQCPAAGNPGQPGKEKRLSAQDLAHLRRGLDQLDQYTLASQGEFIAGLGVDKADVMPGCTLADTTGGKTYTLFPKPFNSGWQIVHPQANVIQRRSLYAWFSIRINGLHQVNLNLPRPGTQAQDVLIDILGLAAVATQRLEPEHVHPQPAQTSFVQAAHSDLLDSQYFEWSLIHTCLPYLLTIRLATLPEKQFQQLPGGRDRRDFSLTHCRFQQRDLASHYRVIP